MAVFTTPAVSSPGEGGIVQAFGSLRMRITTEQTGGAMCVFEMSVPPGEGPPLHIHSREEEFFRVLSGRFGFQCEGREVVLEAGGMIALPRGVPHTFRNVGDEPGSVMCVVTPGHFEHFFRDIERERPAGPEALATLAARYGLTFVPPSVEQGAA